MTLTLDHVIIRAADPAAALAELADQDDDAELAEAFASPAERLERDEQAILDELNGVQGEGVDLGGYYHVDRDKTTRVMRPSATLNEAIDAL